MNREKEMKKIEDARKTFKGFDVVFRNIVGENPLQILELRNPDGSGVYRLRVVFDEKGRTFTITGDLGEAVFYPTWPATLAHTAAVGMNAPYFMEKCACSSDRYEYDETEFRAELEKWMLDRIKAHNEDCDEGDELDEDDVDWDISEVMGGFDTYRGFHGNDKDAQNALAKYGNGLYEGLYDWGKGWHIRVYLWMAGIEYAYAKLKEQAEAENGKGAQS